MFGAGVIPLSCGPGQDWVEVLLSVSAASPHLNRKCSENHNPPHGKEDLSSTAGHHFGVELVPTALRFGRFCTCIRAWNVSARTVKAEDHRYYTNRHLL